ncbi:MAG: nucleotide exchange factor GrpE [Amphritea sp.]
MMAGEDKAQANTEQPEVVVEESVETSAETENLEAVEPVADAAPEEVNVNELQLELAKAQDQIAALKDQELRTQAEMQNVRRRAEMDVEKAHKFALDKFTNELLPVIDSLERAVEASSSKSTTIAALHEGVEMTLGMFVSGLSKFNIEQHNPVGEAFDPALHQAMTMVVSEEVAANNVMAVMQKGYSLNGRLLRPAMVVVSKGSA